MGSAKSMVIALAALLASVPALAAASAAAPGEASEAGPSLAAWPRLASDADGDGVDDALLESRPDGWVEVVVGLERMPDLALRRALVARGLYVTHAGAATPVVTGWVPADASLLAGIAALPGVARVEEAKAAELQNSVARRTVQAQASSSYAQAAWELGYTGAGVVVAVVDTGVADHACVSGKTVGGFDALTGFETDPSDGHGHGTHVACTAVGHGGTPTAPFGTHAGIAPGASLVDVRIFNAQGGGATGTVVARAVDWVLANRDRDWGNGLRGIQVMTNSWGVNIACNGTDSTSVLLNHVASQGIVVLAAAGNDYARGRVNSPGCADDVLTVGAMDDRGTVGRGDDTFADTALGFAAFSNCGPRPSDFDGSSLDERKPDVVAPGVFIRSADASTGTGYADKHGTSMATPMVAGAVALLLERHPELTPAQVRERVRETATDVRTSGWDACTGYGVLNAFALLDTASLAAGFEAPGSQPTGTLLTFVDTSTAGSNALRSRTWDFGDGRTLTRRDATPVTHAYRLPGDYEVRLTVRDASGATSTATATVTALNRAPAAAFDVGGDLAGATLRLTDRSTDADGTVVARSWTVAGAPAGTGAVAEAVLPAGTHTVTLTVTDDGGATSTATAEVQVHDVEPAPLSGTSVLVAATPAGLLGDPVPRGRFAWTVERLAAPGAAVARGGATADTDGVVTVRIPLRSLEPGTAYALHLAPSGRTLAQPLTVEFGGEGVQAVVDGFTHSTSAGRTRLTAALMDADGNPLAGQSLAFTVRDQDGATVATARASTQRGSGAATATVRGLQPDTPYTVDVAFAGKASHWLLAAEATGLDLELVTQATALNATVQEHRGRSLLTGTLRSEAGEPLGRQVVSFTVTEADGSLAQRGSARTLSDGAYRIPLRQLLDGTETVTVTYAGSGRDLLGPSTAGI
ncbi:MAG TPA: S8 family serine peptidase [Candidatus Thermoplasmatota archaeon]|nr:S8 family serine peptidase [Candidatus Thermoplasmatota archaeon]